MSDARAHALLGALIGHYYHYVISAYFPFQLINRFFFQTEVRVCRRAGCDFQPAVMKTCNVEPDRSSMEKSVSEGQAAFFNPLL